MMSLLGGRTCRTFLTVLILAAVGATVALCLLWHPLTWAAFAAFLIVSLVAVCSAGLLIAGSDERSHDGPRKP